MFRSKKVVPERKFEEKSEFKIPEEFVNSEDKVPEELIKIKKIENVKTLLYNFETSDISFCLFRGISGKFKISFKFIKSTEVSELKKKCKPDVSCIIKFNNDDYFKINNYFMLFRYKYFIIYNKNIFPIDGDNFKHIINNSFNKFSALLYNLKDEKKQFKATLEEKDFQLNQYPGYDCDIYITKNGSIILEIEKTNENNLIYTSMYRDKSITELNIENNGESYYIFEYILIGSNIYVKINEHISKKPKVNNKNFDDIILEFENLDDKFDDITLEFGNLTVTLTDNDTIKTLSVLINRNNRNNKNISTERIEYISKYYKENRWNFNVKNISKILNFTNEGKGKNKYKVGKDKEKTVKNIKDKNGFSSF